MVLDLRIFNFINGFAGRWRLLDNLGIFFAVYLGYILLACLVVFLLVYPVKLSRRAGHRFALQIGFDRVNFKKYWRMVVEALLAALFVRFVLVQAFYLIHFRFRPFARNPIHLLIPYDASQTAFPSGHASFYFALSTIIFGYNRKIGIFFYIASTFIVVARIFVGVHWPSDVLAGVILGILMGWLLNKLFKKVHPVK